MVASNLDRTSPEDPESSFIRNYENVARALFAWARLHVKPALRRFLEPEDILQEVCCRAYDSFGDYDSTRGEFRNWIFGIAHNVLRENLRRVGRHRESTVGPEKWPSYASLPDDATSISRRIVRDEGLRRFVDRLENLKEDERRLLLYRGLEGMSHGETAELLELSLDATEKRWQRLLAKLRDWGAELGDLIVN